MKRILFLSLGLLCASPAVLTSCGDSDNGVEEPKKGSLELLEGDTDVHFEVGVNAASVKFSATAAWTAKTSDSWLSVNTPSGVGGYHTLSFTAQRNTQKEERKATVTITSGAQQIVINVTQDANTEEIIDETTIKDLDKYYKPQEFGNMDMFKSTSKWSWARHKQSEHFFVFWEAGFGDDPNATSVPANLRVDIDDLLKKAEQFYTTNITRLGMAEVGSGKSYLDDYKMEIYLLYQDEWLATGSGYDDKIGALWVNPSTCQPVGSTIGHEIGHSFQYQVYCDQVKNGAKNDKKTGFRYGYQGSNGGNGFWEQCAQWQSYQDYPDQYFGDGWYNEWLTNCHRHFENEWMRYASYWLQCYWTEKHGDKTVASVWRNSKAPYDAIQTYQQLYCSDNWALCSEELYDYAAHMATYDVAGPRQYSASHLNDYKTKFYDSGDGYHQVAYAQCPSATGFNVIPLNVPAEGATISADFVGLEVGSALAADDPGYYMEEKDGKMIVVGQMRNYNNVGSKQNAGWHYGFVAYAKGGERKYSPMFSDAQGQASWEVPIGTEYLYMVVLGAPKTYVQSPWDDKELTDAQYPYKVKFTGTDLLGNFTIDENAERQDVSLSFTLPVDADWDGYQQGTLDLSAKRDLAQAFVLQPSEIATLIQTVGTKPAEGNIVWALKQSDGTLGYQSTANNGFWCDDAGSITNWGDNSFNYIEFEGLSIMYGNYPGACVAGTAYELHPVLIYTKDGKQYKADINITLQY